MRLIYDEDLDEATIVAPRSPRGGASRRPARPAAQAKQPLTHETLFLMKRVGSPAVAGREVGRLLRLRARLRREEGVVGPLDRPRGRQRAAAPAHLLERRGERAPPGARTAGGSPSPLGARTTRSRRSTSSTSPAAARRGASRRPRSPPGSRCGAPTSRSIAYQAAVYRGAATPRRIARSPPSARTRSRRCAPTRAFPIRRWDRWLDDTQTHLFVVPADGATARPVTCSREHGWWPMPGLRRPSRRRARRRTSSRSGRRTRSRSSLPPSPTATRSAYESDQHAPVRGPGVRAASRGALTTGNTSYGGPTFSPDGKALCYGYSTKGSDLRRRSRRLRGVAVDGARPAGHRVLRPLGRRVRLCPRRPVRCTSPRRTSGFVRLFSVPVDRRHGGPGAGLARRVQRDHGARRRAAAVRRRGLAARPPARPRSSASIPGHGSTWRSPRSTRDRPPPSTGRRCSEFWFVNAQGRRIHNFVALPPGFDPAKKYPLLVLMHGGHANMWRDSITLRWNYHLLASPGYVVLLTDYRGSTGYGEQLHPGHPGRSRCAAPPTTSTRPPTRPSRGSRSSTATRQAAAGASYGGHLANWLEATTGRYKCLVSHAGLSSLADPVGDQRRHLSPRADDGRPVLGEGRRRGGAEPDRARAATSRRRCCSRSARTTSACR